MIEFGILGPLEVRGPDGPLPLKGARRRAVLTYLVLHANQVVSAERLVDELWGEAAPAGAANALQAHVSQLRKLLDAAGAGGLLETRAPGYRLTVPRGALDRERFGGLAESGRAALAAGDPRAAAAALREALELWRGPALADLAGEQPFVDEALGLEELRVAALEDRIEADLALGRHAELVPELERLIAANPFRERLRRQLMLALYRAGRQADALEAYREARHALVEELGLEPSPELQQLERAILRQDPMLAPPPPAPAAAPPARLPSGGTRFVGRERELDDAIALLRRDGVRLLTLTGPGGIGKTRLALELARRLAPEFADGAAFVGLAAAAEQALVAPTIATALGVAEAGAEPAERLVEHLRDREVLLVLDNFEQVVESAPLLAELLEAAPQLKLVVTSQAVLRLAPEQEFAVPPLATDEARALFVERAQAADRAFTLENGGREAVDEICVRLDGLPLAIELAAARVKLLPPVAMLPRLARRLDLLAAGTRDAPARQRTLRAALEWSFGLLAASERRLLARLGVFAGGCTLEAAEAVAGDDIDVLGGLAALVDNSLLRRSVHEEPRFGLLETVRDYALERLAESGEEEAVRRRHAAYYAGLAADAEPALLGPAQGEWLDRLEREHDNLRAALAFGLEHDRDLALGLAVALRRFWEIHGHVAEGLRTVAAALEGREDVSLERAKALNCAGIFAAEQGDYEEAERFFRPALAVAEELGDPERVARTLGNLGNLALFRGDRRAAKELYEDAVRVWRTAPEPRLAISLGNLGTLAFYEGDVDRALALYEEAREAAEKAGDLRQVAAAQRDVGRVLVVLGELERSRELVEGSLATARELGEPRGIAGCLETLAALAAATDDQARAAALLGAADAVRESSGVRRAPDEGAEIEALRHDVRARLGDTGFEAEYERGRNAL